MGEKPLFKRRGLTFVPGSWALKSGGFRAMLLIGFAGIGFAAYRSRAMVRTTDPTQRRRCHLQN